MTKGLMYQGGPSAKTTARLAGAVIKEFGREDGAAIIDWLIDMIQKTASVTLVLTNRHKDGSHCADKSKCLRAHLYAAPREPK